MGTTVTISDNGRVEGYLTIKEYAERHNTTPGAIRRLIGRGRFETLKIATGESPGNIQHWIREDYIYVPYKRVKNWTPKKTPPYEKIKLFKLKPNADISSVSESTHFSYISKDCVRGFFVNLGHEITLNVGFPKNLLKWNDWNYVLVIDEEFGQPYTPFYKYLINEIEAFPALLEIVHAYNEEMSKLEYLEEIHD